MVNAELNDRCSFSSACGPACILNQLGSGRYPEMSDFAYRSFLRDLARHGQSVENLALVGKEPTETPDRLAETLRIVRSATIESRPLRIGMITAGHRLPHIRGILAEHPLDWLLVSLDTPETGLRHERQVPSSFRHGVSTKEMGGTGQLGVNTIMHPANLGGMAKIGAMVMDEPAVDQWSLSPMLATHSGGLRSLLSPEQLRELLARILSLHGDAPKPILVNLEYADLVQMIGGERFLSDPLRFWRVEHPVKDTSVTLVAMNPLPGYFLRLRYFGALQTREEFHRGGEEGGRIGDFGNLTRKLRMMSNERKSAAAASPLFP